MSDQTILDGNAQWPAVERRKAGLDWQSSVERDKASLARLLHDETGGLLVAAVMDITSAEKQLSDRPNIRGQLARARLALDQAIVINRRVIEELRPTLLENFGLVVALKWHFSKVCEAAQVRCHHVFSDEQARYAPSASISLYRVAETLLSILVVHRPSDLQLEMRTSSDRLTLRATAQHIERTFDREEHDTASALASAQGRLAALGGHLQIEDARRALSVVCDVALRSVAEH